MLLAGCEEENNIKANGMELIANKCVSTGEYFVTSEARGLARSPTYEDVTYYVYECSVDLGKARKRISTTKIEKLK